jgi:hypothetical protein
MDISTQIVPAIVLLVANLMSGPHTSLRWEKVTAVFGWGTLFSVLALVGVSIVNPDSAAIDYLLQAAGFCLLTALSRDYERILKLLFPWNR